MRRFNQRANVMMEIFRNTQGACVRETIQGSPAGNYAIGEGVRYSGSRVGKHHQKRKINNLLQRMDGNMSSKITQEAESVKGSEWGGGGGLCF